MTYKPNNLFFGYFDICHVVFWVNNGDCTI